MLPRINQNLFIQVASVDDKEANEEYKARIADVDTEFISMEVPISMKSGNLKRLFPGDQLSIYFLTEGGVKNFFQSEVVGYREETIRLVIIRIPEPDQITTIQRRSFLRVSSELEIAVKLQNKLQITALTDDVGGGGVSFICERHVPVKNKELVTGWLLLQYKNGVVDHMPFKAEVVRIKQLETGRQLVMCSFTEILDHERQKVIRYCFEKQIDLRK